MSLLRTDGQDIIKEMQGRSKSKILILLILLGIFTFLVVLVIHLYQTNQELENARQAILSRNSRQAAVYLANAAGRLPWRSDLWELAGYYAYQAGDMTLAIRHLERAGLVNLTTHGLVTLGDAYQQTGDLHAAIRTWQTDAQRANPSPASLERLAYAYRRLGDYSSAIAILRRLTAIQPNNADYWYELGLLLSTQQPELALAPLKVAEDLAPGLYTPVRELRQSILNTRQAENSAYALLIAGRTLATFGEWELATETFRQATLQQPNFSEAWAYLGEALQHLSPPPEKSGAVENLNQAGYAELQKALQLDSNSLAAHTFLALYWTRRGDHVQALQAIQSAIKLEPENPALHVELGNILALSGDLQSGYEAFQQAISLAPQDPAYLRHLATYSLHNGYQVEQVGLPAARQAVILAPDDPANPDMMAQILIRLGDLASAERYLHQSLRSDPRYAPAHLHLGLIYLFKGEQQTAYQEFKLAGSLGRGSTIDDQAQRLLETYFP